jgi:septal ring factor EnvC (AmiA/AmiB activator)
MSSSTRRQQQQERDNEYSITQQQQEQQEATIRSIDMTKDNIRRSIEEVRRETPRYSQTVTDFQNETADASAEIADNFLESQKEVHHSAGHRFYHERNLCALLARFLYYSV